MFLPSASFIRLTILTALTAALGLGQNYLHTNGNQILDASNRPVRLTGVNWFGLETSNFAPHGLWTRSMGSMLDQIRDLGYNTIRVPFSNQLFDGGSNPNGIDYSQNQDLQGLTGIQIMDRLITGAGARGLKVILDRHRPDANSQSELWYTGSYSQDRWIADWRMLASRYLGNDTVVGFDLHNEPHGRATWGDNNSATDWRLAAEAAGNAILAINPKLLIIVEGIERIGNDYYWWGGNLSAAGTYPVRLNVANQLVYSAHDYPASVYGQPWFYASNYPANLPPIWDSHWGYLHNSNIAPVLLGEFGTFNRTNVDQMWFRTLANYIASKQLNFTYWSWNPNSGDTGGILQDDWRTVNSDKQAILQPLLAPPVGTGGGGGTVTPPPLAPPSGLTAVSGSQQVSLNWTASATASGYRVFRGTQPGGSGVEVSTGAGTSFLDQGLTNGITYYYYVVATEAARISVRSAEVRATPTAAVSLPVPPNVVATSGDRQVAISWNAVSGATSYNLYRALTTNGQATSAAYQSNITQASYIDSGLTNGTTYYYKVSAVNSAGEGAQSSVVEGKPLAAAPSGNLNVVGRVASGTSAYWGQLDVLLTNSAPITGLSIQVTVRKTPGINYSGQYNNYWGNMLSMSKSESSANIVYTYTLNPGQSVPAGSNWLVAAQFGGNGSPHATSGDTYTVTASSGGTTRTFAGTF